MATDNKWVTKWHEDYQPDPHPQVGDIYSGLRAPVGIRAKDVTSPCQYWIKGMPGICKNFQDDKCIVESEDGKYPTGYNNGKCDYLGRRNWCDKYDNVGTENLEEYTCIAPDMFRTGLGKRDETVTTHLELISYPKSEILGYNADDKGAGQCDGLGMGRGKTGKDKGTTDPEQLYKLPVVCRHYKPWIMGFGAIKPRPLGTAILEDRDVYDGSEADPLTSMSRYLPFIFRMLNLRAYYQKCAYWKQDYGTFFEMDYSGGYATITLPEDPLTECTCENDACTPYKTIISTWPENSSDTLVDVLTEEGNFICNGAHSECPCYTGKWYYCIADNMRDGMRITAEQILEIRFWTAVWQTKEIYDSIFAEKSGPLDITTSDLFTFDRWEKLGADVNDSVMKGKRIYQCFPIPYHQRMFDPEVYLTKEAITYPKADAETGTSTSTTSAFPTLIRKIDDAGLVSPLDVIYPYPYKDPWNIKPCDKDVSIEPMEIASCKMESPATAIFGYTVRNRKVYALNITKLTLGKSIDFSQFKSTTVSLLPDKERQKINESINDLITTSMENGVDSKYIIEGSSNKYGYFEIGPLPLEYNTTTTIVIICKTNITGESEYEIIVRDVKSKFYGACILQDNFEFKYGNESAGYDISLPSSFSPSAKLGGKVYVWGDIHSVFPVYHSYEYGMMQDKTKYSYCVNEYTIKGEDALVSTWVRIGPTGYIWASINNIKLSYLFNFKIVKAYMKPKSKDMDVCGDTSGANIELDIILPKEGNSGDIKREHIPPNCVMLKATNPISFFNEDWDLFIEYKYELLETTKALKDSTTEKVVWPPHLDEEAYSVKFVGVPFTFLRESFDSFVVKDLRSSTVTIMVYVKDMDGRIQAATATKMLQNVPVMGCRSVEIFYRYNADAVGYNLTPSTGIFHWKGANRTLDGRFTHYRTPLCGDHEINFATGKGPMWFPFSACNLEDYYRSYNPANFCTSPIEGSPRSDYRYGTVEKYKAWVEPGGAWIFTCVDGWSYFFSKAELSNVQFSGYGNIKAPVDTVVYGAKGWQLPPFGNSGREYTERWFSQDTCGFWDSSGVSPSSKSEYLPLVFDDSTLFTSFNAFEGQSRTGDYFNTICTLNYMLSDIIDEVVKENRYRFEDLFEIRKHAWCMYPPPIYWSSGGTATTIRYSFKIENIAWAWREYWRDIERGISGLLNFVIPIRPDYYFTFEKIEHRLITDEGNINIVFTAPRKKDDEFTYPEISINNAYPRKFKIIYNEYTSEQIEWMDEGGDGLEDESGGTEEQSIYEKAMGNDWFHDVDIIFDENASAEKSESRKISFSADTANDKWYNRGLIFNIPKERLVYLPYKEEHAIFDEDYIHKFSRPADEDMLWYNKAIFSDEIVFSYTPSIFPFCLTRVDIFGYTGIKESKIFCKPEIVIAEYGKNDVGGDVDDIPDFPPTILYTSKGVLGKKEIEDDFYIKIDLDRIPDRMLYTPTNIQIKFTVFSDQHLKLDRVDLYISEYVDAVETIKVWEQRYITSTGNFGDVNPDGVESWKIRSYDRDMKNAGQYFPASSIFYPDAIKCKDKMVMISAGKRYTEDEELDITIQNLMHTEEIEQRTLYEAARNKDEYDEITYSTIIPPNIQQFFDANNIMSYGFGGSCKFISEKLPWAKYRLQINMNKSKATMEFWQPGGHFYVWSDKFREEFCWLFSSPMYTLYSTKFVHYKHGGDEYMIIDPLTAYLGETRLAYQEGVLSQQFGGGIFEMEWGSL